MSCVCNDNGCLCVEGATSYNCDAEGNGCKEALLNIPLEEGDEYFDSTDTDKGVVEVGREAAMTSSYQLGVGVGYQIGREDVPSPYAPVRQPIGMGVEAIVNRMDAAMNTTAAANTTSTTGVGVPMDIDETWSSG